MQFDESAMKKLLGESDEALWQTIRTLAGQNGIRLPAGRPSAGDMARLRAILATRGPKDVKDAEEILRRARGEQ